MSAQVQHSYFIKFTDKDGKYKDTYYSMSKEFEGVPKEKATRMNFRTAATVKAVFNSDRFKSRHAGNAPAGAVILKELKTSKEKK
jgi:hypothetical protein